MVRRRQGKDETVERSTSDLGPSGRARLDQHGSEAEVRSKPCEEGDSAAADLAPGLYVVATPIGNLADITLRALAVLGAVDVIACEDTRITRRLLDRYGLATPLTPYHEHNAAAVRPRLLTRLQAGGRVALVSDAGTPLISDPGYRLVRACRDAGVAVVPLPGASSVLAALSAAGLPTDRFLFGGFLPPRAAARRKALEALVPLQATLVFLESPRRLAAALADMAAVFGPREAAVARELTKRFEEIVCGHLDMLAERYAAPAPVKGEITVVVAPPGERPAVSAADVDALLEAALAHSTVRDAAASVAAASGLPRREVYARAVEIARGRR